MTFSPKLNILPASQRALWKELKATPKHFVLPAFMNANAHEYSTKHLQLPSELLRFSVVCLAGCSS